MCNNLIMPLPDLLKNITSKDKNISQNTIKMLVKTGDLSNYKYLCENSEFIFPFIKERIINDFVKLINKNDLDTIFKFAQIYNYDFEDLIIKSWLKFADEDLTDKILDFFENGSDEIKTYCAKYFSYIKDSLAIEQLNKNAFSDFMPLKINCAKTLKEFNDFEVLNKMKNLILNSKDEFEKLSAYTFVLAYGENNSTQFCLENCFNSPFLANIISNLLDFNDFKTLENIFKEDSIARIFGVLIENYPENISLNTIIYYQISDFIKYLSKFENQYIKNLLALAKLNFQEYCDNDIYSFDLDKDTKLELKNICAFLNSLDFNFDNIEQEFNNIEQAYRFEIALKIVNEYKLKNKVQILANKINENELPVNLITATMQVLKNLGAVQLVNKKIIENIKDENIKAFIESCYS